MTDKELHNYILDEEIQYTRDPNSNIWINGIVTATVLQLDNFNPDLNQFRKPFLFVRPEAGGPPEMVTKVQCIRTKQ